MASKKLNAEFLFSFKAAHQRRSNLSVFKLLSLRNCIFLIDNEFAFREKYLVLVCVDARLPADDIFKMHHI